MPASLSDAELGQYETLADFELGFAPIRMCKLRSKVTGLRVVVADYKGEYCWSICPSSQYETDDLKPIMSFFSVCASAPIVSGSVHF
jgi:hypothetical protein